jgi:glycosyltransferase involved in cell wall biosynthesis
MKVLHIAAGNLYGGVERILEEIARHAPAGSVHEFALAFEGRLSRGLTLAGGTRHALGRVRFSRPLSVWLARRRIRRLVKDRGYHAIVGHAPWAFALAAPAAGGARKVMWAHDASRGDHWTERRAARYAPDLVICNSRYTSEAIAGWLNGVTRTVIYAPVSAPDSDRDARDAVRQDLGVGQGTSVILMASRMERWKGHAELIRSAAKLSGDWTVWIAGGAQRPHEVEYERELRALAATLGVRDRITFLGERTDVSRLFRAADIHCQPNTAPEPFGVAFVEALYAALPVVTIDMGGAREIVTPACGILVAPGDADGLTRALQGLLDNPAGRAALGAGGPARARALCDPGPQLLALEAALA